MGLQNKLDELKNHVAQHKPDLVCITETHLTDTRSDGSPLL